MITPCNFHLVPVLEVLGEEKENGVALIDIGDGGCDSHSLLGSAGRGGRKDHACSYKSSDELSKQ